MQPLAISQELSQKLANMAFIAALLVVAIHVREGSIIGSFNWHVYQIIVDGFARIAVPFFFLAAGFFLAGHCTGPGWWLRECKKRIKTLVAPFFVWQILWAMYAIMLTFLFLPFTKTVSTSINDYVLNLITLGFNINEEPVLGVLWFVRNLILLVLLSPLLLSFLRGNKLKGYSLLIVFYGLYCCFGGFLGPDLFFSSDGLFFFSLGIFLRYHPITIKLPCWVMVILFLLCLGSYFLMCQARLGSAIMPLLYAKQIFIPTMLFLCWQWVPTNTWPKTITSCSFPIYLLHMFVLFPLHGIIKIIPSMWIKEGWGSYLLTWGLAVLITLAIALFMRKYCAKLSAFLFGGR